MEGISRIIDLGLKDDLMEEAIAERKIEKRRELGNSPGHRARSRQRKLKNKARKLSKRKNRK